MARILTPNEARAFYDRLGRGQDSQRFYEDAAIDDLIAHAAFDTAATVFEFGFGTGRLADRLLSDHLPADALYRGVDISPVMHRLASERLAGFGARAQVILSDGAAELPVDNAGVDRLVSTYVLDLLPEDAIVTFMDEAHRILTTGGLLCLASLTKGDGAVSHLVSGLLHVLHTIHPTLTGGCRAIEITDFLGPSWQLRHRAVVVSYGIPSEVVIAAKA